MIEITSDQFNHGSGILLILMGAFMSINIYGLIGSKFLALSFFCLCLLISYFAYGFSLIAVLVKLFGLISLDKIVDFLVYLSAVLLSISPVAFKLAVNIFNKRK